MKLIKMVTDVTNQEIKMQITIISTEVMNTKTKNVMRRKIATVIRIRSHFVS